MGSEVKSQKSKVKSVEVLVMTEYNFATLTL